MIQDRVRRTDYRLETWRVSSPRMSRNFALISAAFSLPTRINIFWPAEHASSAGSANR